MRLLHLDTGREMRGGQWQVLQLMEGLAAAGVEQALLARAGSPLFEGAQKAGRRVEPIGLARVLLLGRRADLIHAHDARGHTLAAMQQAVPLVVSRRVAFPIGSRWKYGRPRRYLAVSEFVKSVLERGKVPADRIVVVPDGVKLPLAAAAGEEVLYIDKGTSVAQEAARLAGINARAAGGLEHDLPKASMLVYLTESEGLGSGALMAMAAGVPVIASRTGGLPEIVRNGENGLLVDNRPEEVAAAMRRLTADPALARRMGEAGRRMIREGFTVEHLVSRTMEVYRTVLA